jgi:hypothetical protein
MNLDAIENTVVHAMGISCGTFVAAGAYKKAGTLACCSFFLSALNVHILSVFLYQKIYLD